MNRKKNKEANNRLDEFIERNDPADDFEKDALEGFSAFDKEEIVNAQAELDARFSEKIKDHSQTSSRRAYWVAAAALLIISGFSGYFLLQNSRSSNDLALQQTTTTPHTPPQIPEEKTTEPAVAASQPAPIKSNDTKRSTPQTIETTGKLQFKEEAVAEPVNTAVENSDTLGVKYESIAKDQSAGLASANVSSNNDELMVASESIQLDEEENQNKKVARQSKKKQMERVAVAPSAATAPAGKSIVSNNAYYQKGEKALYKIIAEKLSAKDMLHRFDARLYINQNGVVDSSRIFNSYKLTTEEQTKIKAELKGLDGFVFSNTQGQNVPAEYVIRFNP